MRSMIVCSAGPPEQCVPPRITRWSSYPNFSSARAFSLEPLASHAKSNYASFGEGLKLIGQMKDSVCVCV